MVKVLTAANLHVVRQNSVDDKFLGSVVVMLTRTNLVRVTDEHVSTCPMLARATVMTDFMSTAKTVTTYRTGR